MNEATSPADFWCPIEDARTAHASSSRLEMTPEEGFALSRFSAGEWVSDQLIERLERLGLIEKVFGQPLLTRLGRMTAGETA